MTHRARNQSGFSPLIRALTTNSQIVSLDFKIPLSHLKYNFPPSLTKERIHMLDHIILTVSLVERSLKFYTAALNPLKIKMSEPYKGKDGHPDLWGFGDDQKTFFWLKQGQPDPSLNPLGLHRGKQQSGRCLLQGCDCCRRKEQYLASRSSGILSRLLRRGRV